MLYYIPRQYEKDWCVKVRIEEELCRHPSYGSRRLALALCVNRKRTQRVMRLFGLKPYRRRGRKRRKTIVSRTYPNLLLTAIPAFPGHVWAADFTELWRRGTKVYVATVIDLFTREIIGVHIALRKGVTLTLQALYAALHRNQRPGILHSDNGKEYDAKLFAGTLTELGIAISRSRPGCPWENGYQESFYDKFKLDLGDPNRFESLGELVAEVHRTIWEYNNTRIHSALKMPPKTFTNRYFEAQKLVESVSKEWGP